MKTIRYHFIVICILAITSTTLKAQSNHHLVDWSSQQGIQRLSESQYKTDFFQLAMHFQSQPNGVLCGPTSGAIVLNALRSKTTKPEQLPLTQVDPRNSEVLPKETDLRLRLYRPNNFIGPITNKVKSRAQLFGEPINGKPDFGLQIRQLHRMFLAHNSQSTLRIVDESITVDDMRKDMLKNLKNQNDYIVVNYSRTLLGQEGPGHISPVAAYHSNSDSFLIMDVTSYQHNWVWVPANTLYLAMKSFDSVENRGYLSISDSP